MKHEIALCGAPLCGKSTIVQKFGQKLGLDLSFQEADVTHWLVKAASSTPTALSVMSPRGAMFEPKRTFRDVLEGCTHPFFVWSVPLPDDQGNEPALRSFIEWQDSHHQKFQQVIKELDFTRLEIHYILSKIDLIDDWQEFSRRLPISRPIDFPISCETEQGLDELIQFLADSA